VKVQAGTCPMKYMPNAQKAADMTVPKTANIVMVLENGCENSMCRHEQRCISAPDVFEEVQLVEAVAVLEQNHWQKVKKNGARL